MFYQTTEDYRIFEKEVPEDGIDRGAQSSLSFCGVRYHSHSLFHWQYLIVSAFTFGWRIASFSPFLQSPFWLSLNSPTLSLFSRFHRVSFPCCRPETRKSRGLNGTRTHSSGTKRVFFNIVISPSGWERKREEEEEEEEEKKDAHAVSEILRPGLLSGDENFFLRFSRADCLASQQKFLLPSPKSTSLFFLAFRYTPFG